MSVPRRPVTRWITPNRYRIDLIYATFTTGGARDGWWLVCRHPDSGVIVSEIPMDLDHSDPEVRAAAETALQTALADVGALRWIGPRDAEKR